MKNELKIQEHMSDFDHVRRCITAWYFSADVKLITFLSLRLV